VVRCEGDVPQARRCNSNERKEINKIKETVGLKRTGVYDVQRITWMNVMVAAAVRLRILAAP